ncbi:diguanylate cyclase [Nguyenibacter sp. L1]|uniref:sensor domain-containing diguanylate cyclase n=1 Tax=Nguyenibacter sp. L1 TaxID=3049350 RepID=UPI002B48604C|nr:diguanylate cyclase [Nguyenibacter sp. L1]WRH88725.1 diguanylate cyclase [Nguyenibacter sp. L1]
MLEVGHSASADLYQSGCGVRQDFSDILALAIEGSGTGVWDRDVVTGAIRYCDGWVGLLGYRREEISDRIEDAYARVHPDDLAYVQATMRDHFAGLTPSYEVEHRLRCRDGSYKWVLSRGRVISRDGDGRALRMVGTTTDITAMRVLAERLRASMTLLSSLTDQVPGLVFQCRRAPDGTACVPYASARITEIYELTPQQVAESCQPVHARIHPDDLDLYRATLAEAAERLTPWQCVFRVLLPRQGLRWRQVDARATRLPDGGTLWHGLVVDVTERKRVEQELHDLARVDHLTCLPNRRAFTERMERAWHALVRGRAGDVAVLMLDIDHFKSINDRHGHTAGDAVLRRVAATMLAELRPGDHAGRLGGEEFAVVLPDTGLAQARQVAERLRRALAECRIPVADGTMRLTVSIGLSDMRATDCRYDDALARADMALYAAKEAGRNRTGVSGERVG